jgi:hypothetical protein
MVIIMDHCQILENPIAILPATVGDDGQTKNPNNIPLAKN